MSASRCGEPNRRPQGHFYVEYAVEFGCFASSIT